MRIPLALQSYRHDSLPVSSQRALNLMAERQPQDAKAPVILMPSPGLDLFATLPDGPIRGMEILKDRLIVVSGAVVCSVGVGGSFTALGVVDLGGPVRMAANTDEMVIVVPETRRAWIATLDTLTEITSENFEGAVDVASVDGFHIFVRPDSTTVFGSALNDAATYDPLAFVSAEGSADNVVAVRRVGTSLAILGERSLELFANNGGADPLPFSRIPGAYIDRGCAAPASAVQIAGTLFWLGDDKSAYAMQDLNPQRISTHAVAQAWSGYTTVNDAVAWAYEQRGHVFYVISFPTAGDTWVYDTTTQVWHERESEPFRAYGGIWRAWLGLSYGGAVIAGDARGGRLYRVNPVRHDEDGDRIIRIATGMPLHREGKRLFHRSLHLEAEMGVGIPSGQGSAPVVWLRYSDTGGNEWGDLGERSIGPIGRRYVRAEWHRLGMSRDRVYELRYSDPVPLTITGINIEAEAEQ